MIDDHSSPVPNSSSPSSVPEPITESQQPELKEIADEKLADNPVPQPDSIVSSPLSSGDSLPPEASSPLSPSDTPILPSPIEPVSSPDTDLSNRPDFSIPTNPPPDANRPTSSISADYSHLPADSNQQSVNITQPSSEPNRPDSVDSADYSNTPNLADTPATTSTPSSSLPQELVSPISADLSADLSAESSAKVEASAKVDSPPIAISPTETLAEETSSAPVLEETSSPNQTPASPFPVVSIPDLSIPSDLSLSADEAGNPPPINVSPPEIQVPQVQPEAPNNTSQIDTGQSEIQSAEIKLEPLGSPAMPSTPSENVQSPSQTVSFGDLLANTGNSPSPSSQTPQTDQPSSPPSQSSPSPSQSVLPAEAAVSTSSSQPSSFGDLLKDSLKIEPTINIEPIEPQVSPLSPFVSLPSSPNPQPITDSLQLSPQSPISSPSPISDIKDKLVLLRQQAKQKKAQKKQAILQKIIDLAKTKGRLNNQEAQKILHLPQSTLTDYFKELVSTGILKKEGKGKATFYHL